jgi:8-oxo-dGTP pyrophosphatase MutT (NUDIX family)
VFDLDRASFVPPEGGEAREYYVIDAPDWINVIALTDENEVLMVRQYRFGISWLTLEIPGGMCDVRERPAVAAARELAEETGYRASSLTALGWVHPNPPIQNNRCHTFLARGLRRAGSPGPDSDERLELLRVRLDSVPALIADGTITHALVLAAFHLLHVAGISPAISRPGP